MILLVDCFDSFSYNLRNLVEEAYEDCHCIRIDRLSAKDFESARGIVLSPGPGQPNDYPKLMNLVRAHWQVRPIFGVCLGFQVLAQAFGGQVGKAARPMHGKITKVEHFHHEMFAGIPQKFSATRYHSLRLVSVPSELEITAQDESGTPMALAHKKNHIIGVQYHPEAALTQYSDVLVKNWLAGF